MVDIDELMNTKRGVSLSIDSKLLKRINQEKFNLIESP